MFPIWKYGSEEQKEEWLPRMASGQAIGCFGLTEPDAGSDPASMRTSARRDGPGDGADWILNGSKMWITNGGLADIAVVWARTDDDIRGFLVPRGTKGFETRDMHHKLSLRASVTSELLFDECRLPASAVLPGVRGLKGPLSCLSEARYGIVWGAMGAARACFDAAAEYSKTRVQFGRPIGGFQLTQGKLADMLVELEKGLLLALHLGRLKDTGRLRPDQVSLGKLNNVREALAIAPRGPDDPRRERDHPRVPGPPAREQPRVGAHVRGHGRDPPARAGQGDHRARRVLVTSSGSATRARMPSRGAHSQLGRYVAA